MRRALRVTSTAACLAVAGLRGPSVAAQQASPSSEPVVERPAAGVDTAAPGTAQAARPSFVDWLRELRREALDRGLRPEVVDEAIRDLTEPLPVIIDRDRRQAETVLTLEAYISSRLTAPAVARGRDMARRFRSELTQASNAYGVPPGIIAGIWGIESNYGAFSGTRPTIGALATLAWDPRRSTLFRRELLDALTMLDRGDIELTRMRGSWAGAMGQPQFMPSSYLAYAVDGDGDGRRDIWRSTADVLASIANYLRGHGWRRGEDWGREVRIPSEALRVINREVARRGGSCSARRDMTIALPFHDWRSMGVSVLSGAPIADDQPAALVSGASRHFLTFDNYDALLEYNCAHAYALSVALLGERLASSRPAPTRARPALPASPPQPRPRPQ